MDSSNNNGDAPVLVWFRDDLRTEDHPALFHASKTGAPVLCVYVHDSQTDGIRDRGAAQKWFLHYGLEELGNRIRGFGGRFDILVGAQEEVIRSLVANHGVSAVYWNRRCGKTEIEIDKQLKSDFTGDEIEVNTFQGNLLHEPFSVETSSGGPYKVYTPFWRALSGKGDPREPFGEPEGLKHGPVLEKAVSVDGLKLLPENPDWASEHGWAKLWSPGEKGAKAALEQFLDDDVNHYKNGRDLPAKDWTSRLSPFLRHGMISPYSIWNAVRHGEDSGKIKGEHGLTFRKELAWREFSYHLLFHFPDIGWENYQEKFDDFPWREDGGKDLKCWQEGQTGYPIVDAGMRQLWQTGYMHNRVRMITGSFLVKHLLIHWREGEAWFWDTLVDADPANNTASWQWIAGSGADAAPYFRVFNPILQGEKFDKDGEYVRRFVPELANLPKKYIHKPWEAPSEVLEEAGIELGETYPHPIIEHKRGRERALEAFDEIKKAS